VLENRFVRHCVSIDDFTESEVLELCRSALKKPPAFRPIDPAKPAVGLVFLEPSTRTAVSFIRACQRIGLNHVLVLSKGTSIEKGETVEDTLRNLKAMGMGSFVIRTQVTGGLQGCRDLGLGPVVNAGDGVGEHPTQALLDLTTLLDLVHWDEGRLRALKIGIYGDLRHSRVAQSWSKLARKLGIRLTLMSPEEWRPAWAVDHDWSDSRSAIKDQDVVMALRVQRERMDGPAAAVTEAFVNNFRLGRRDLAEHQRLMHPGPINWGVELEPDWLEDPRSLILKQAEMGVLLRAKLLEWVLETKS